MRSFPRQFEARPNSLGVWLAQRLPTVEFWAHEIHIGFVEDTWSVQALCGWEPRLRAGPRIVINRRGVRFFARDGHTVVLGIVRGWSAKRRSSLNLTLGRSYQRRVE